MPRSVCVLGTPRPWVCTITAGAWCRLTLVRRRLRSLVQFRPVSSNLVRTSLSDNRRRRRRDSRLRRRLRRLRRRRRRRLRRRLRRRYRRRDSRRDSRRRDRRRDRRRYELLLLFLPSPNPPPEEIAISRSDEASHEASEGESAARARRPMSVVLSVGPSASAETFPSAVELKGRVRRV